MPVPRLRTAFAFLIAPLAIPFGMALVSGPSSLGNFCGLVALYSLVGLPPAYVFELLFGVPAWLIFCRYGFRSWGMFASGGIVLGMGYCLLFSGIAAVAKSSGYDIYAHSFTRYWLNPMAFAFDVPAGLLSALLFRAIAFPWRSKDNPTASAI